MAFDLIRIREELQAAPLPSPYPLELAVAVVTDCLRAGGAAPVAARTWRAWTARKDSPLLGEQLGMLAHLLAVTSLRAESARALESRTLDPEAALPPFFESVRPLTAEMIRANAFRQEEFLRKWIALVGGEVRGESARESRKRLEQLDYRKTLAEYDRAEKARLAEAERRAKLLEEAARREADARGWRE